MLELKATSRKVSGKQVKTLRQKGILPVVLYGEGLKTESLSVSYKEFEKAWKAVGESQILHLDLEGKAHNVLIHDMTIDPMKGTFMHADFYAVRMDRVLRVRVPLEFVGESPAVKNDGGILVKVLHELEVEALPKDLPRELQADISKLSAFEARLTVKYIPLSEGVKVVADENEVIALIERPRSEEELAALSQAPIAPELAEVKTEQEVKREEKVVEEEPEKE